MRKGKLEPMGINLAKKSREGGAQVLLSLACVVIIVTGLKLAAAICVPIAIGIFLGILSLPILQFFVRTLRFPRFIAIAATVLIDLLVLGAVAFVISGVIPEVQKRGPEYAERLRKQAAYYSTEIDKQLLKLEKYGQYFGIEPDQKDDGTGKKLPTFQEMFNKYWDTQRFLALLGQTSLVERFTSLTSKSFLVLILMVFFLAESRRFGDKVRDIVKERGPNLIRFERSVQDVQHYLIIKFVTSLFTGIFAWIACSVMKVEFALFWGMIAFTFNFIPVIGSIVAAIPPVLVALIMQGIWPAFIILCAYLVINNVIGNFLEPKIVGDSFGISTIIVIMSVLFWGFVWGPAGMFLAVPLTMIVKVMLDNTPELRWISVLISTKKEETPAGSSSSRRMPFFRKSRAEKNNVLQ